MKVRSVGRRAVRESPRAVQAVPTPGAAEIRRHGAVAGQMKVSQRAGQAASNERSLGAGAAHDDHRKPVERAVRRPHLFLCTTAVTGSPVVQVFRAHGSSPAGERLRMGGETSPTRSRACGLRPKSLTHAERSEAQDLGPSKKSLARRGSAAGEGFRTGDEMPAATAARASNEKGPAPKRGASRSILKSPSPGPALTS